MYVSGELLRNRLDAAIAIVLEARVLRRVSPFLPLYLSSISIQVGRPVSVCPDAPGRSFFLWEATARRTWPCTSDQHSFRFIDENHQPEIDALSQALDKSTACVIYPIRGDRLFFRQG
ncbi:unnamed protein product [Mycena citricolor]|uniref:Uncharacterized protein n=1 Tax=Mycena citricolor TaxID=2018698 RepID=A0AAD2Q421_9AGAR|nr:unnamed protein product [Mycena citricolor]